LKNFACVNLNCKDLTGASLQDCEDKRCPFKYQRGRVEDELERVRKDAIEVAWILTVENGGPA
jgi:hypothetical protein